MLSGKKSTLWFWSNAALCDFGFNASSGVRAKTKRQLLAFVYVQESLRIRRSCLFDFLPCSLDRTNPFLGSFCPFYGEDYVVLEAADSIHSDWNDYLFVLLNVDQVRLK